MNRFAKFSWGVLIWAIFVVLWGTIVRATGSGAGCGNHWPTCNGEIFPSTSQIQTTIEFTHRIMSGSLLISIFVLLVWGLAKYPKGHYQRIGIIGSAVFIIFEAILGAGLVLFKLVGSNSSIFRAAAVSSHLVNTFLLLGILTLNAFWASGGQKPVIFPFRKDSKLLLLGLIGILFVGVTGAITALGDTLFPSTSVIDSLNGFTKNGLHFLVQLRIYHPVIAIIVGSYSLYLLKFYYNKSTINPGTKR